MIPPRVMYSCRYDKINSAPISILITKRLTKHSYLRANGCQDKIRGSLHKLVLNDGSGEGWSCELPLYHNITWWLHPRDYPVKPAAIVFNTLLGHPIILYRHMGCSHQSPKPIRCTKPVSPQRSESAYQKKEHIAIWVIYLFNIHGYLIIQISISIFQVELA
jgi:hypothetical protein